MKLYILNYVIIILFLITIYIKREDKYEMGGILILFLFYLYFYYYYYWPESYKVTPLQQFDYSNKMLWLDLSEVNVHETKNKRWANDILINDAPNIIGLHVTKKNISKPELSVLLQKFEVLFNHSPKYIYFDYNQANYVQKFLKSKDIKLIEYSFRRQVNSF